MNRKNPPVHNHGPEDGLGLSCPESVVGGFLQGACLLAAEQTDPFSQSPHMASKYWAELVKARKRITELEAAVTVPTEPVWEYGLIGHVDDITPVFESQKFAENELANQIARLQRQADPDPPPVLFQRVKRGPWVEVTS